MPQGSLPAFESFLRSIRVRPTHARRICDAIERLRLDGCSSDDLAALLFIHEAERERVIYAAGRADGQMCFWQDLDVPLIDLPA